MDQKKVSQDIFKDFNINSQEDKEFSLATRNVESDLMNLSRILEE